MYYLQFLDMAVRGGTVLNKTWTDIAWEIHVSRHSGNGVSHLTDLAGYRLPNGVRCVAPEQAALAFRAKVRSSLQGSCNGFCKTKRDPYSFITQPTIITFTFKPSPHYHTISLSASSPKRQGMPWHSTRRHVIAAHFQHLDQSRPPTR